MIELIGALDMHSIQFTMVATNLVCTLVMLLLWKQNQKRLPGLTFWLIDYVFQTLAILLMVLRGQIPDWISIDFANAFTISAVFFGLRGLETFLHLKSKRGRNYLLLLIYPILLSWFAFVQPNMHARNVLVDVFSFLFYLHYVWLIFFKNKRSMLPKTLLIGIVFILYCLVDLLRVSHYFICQVQHQVCFFDEIQEIVLMLSYQMLFIVLTFGLALMFNKRLIDSIQLQEEKYSKAFHTSPYAIILTRMDDGLVLEVNDAFCHYTGFELQEVLGMSTPMLHVWESPNDRAFVMEKLGNHSSVRDMEFHFLKKNGERLTGMYSAEIITIDGEKCVLSSINDITQRVHAIEELKTSEAKFRALFTSMTEGFVLHEVVYDSTNRAIDYRLLEINPAFEKQVGILAEKAKGKLATVVYGQQEAPYLALYAEVAATGLPQSFLAYFQPHDKYYEIIAFSPNKGFFATVFTDVTDKQKAQMFLKESEANFRNLNATKDKFFSIIAHDLKSPFNSILGFSALLQESVQSKEYQKVEEYASIIHRSTLRTMDLLMNLLEWSRSQTGKLDFLPEYLEIHLLVNEVVGLLDHAAKHKSITITMDKVEQLTIFADKLLLGTILRNLISNAIKFTHPGGNILLSASKQGYEMWFCVRDNGVGIKKEDIDKLFLIEESVSRKGTQNEQGTGLGLLLCKEFVEKHDGKIWVESTFEKGSAFFFSLPIPN